MRINISLLYEMSGILDLKINDLINILIIYTHVYLFRYLF